MTILKKNKIVLSEDLAVDENEEVKVEDEIEVEDNEVTDKLLDNAIASMINKLIIDEFEAIDGYNSAISTIISEMPDSPIIDVLNDIIAEENVHVGQLQRALLLVSTPAQDIEKGTEEGKEQIDDGEKEEESKEVEKDEVESEEEIEVVEEDIDRWEYFIDSKFRHAVENAETLEEQIAAVRDLIGEVEKIVVKLGDEALNDFAELEDIQATLTFDKNLDLDEDDLYSILDRLFNFCDDYRIFIKF